MSQRLPCVDLARLEARRGRSRARRLCALSAALTVAGLGMMGGCGDDEAAAGPAFLAVLAAGVYVDPGGMVDFEELAVGQAIVLLFELENYGVGDLLLTGDPPVRLERDDRLGFTITQPTRLRVPPGDAVPFAVTYAPRAPGEDLARIVVASNDPDFPLYVVGLRGRGAPAARGHLALSLADGDAVTHLDHGLVAVGESRSLTLTLTNEGAGRLGLSSGLPLTVEGPDAAAFLPGPAGASSLAPGDSATATLAFSPTRCGAHEATLLVTSDAPDSPLRLPLAARAMVSPLAVASVAPSPTGATPALAAADGGLRVAWGEPVADGFAGRVEVFASTAGCEGGAPLSLDGATSSPSPFFGTAVALSAAGDHLLVTARDHPEVALFGLEPTIDDALEAHLLARLEAEPTNVGFGRQAALADDASAAFVAEPERASAGVPHGAIHAWLRPAEGWLDGATPHALLIAEDPDATRALGHELAVTVGAAQVVALALTPDGAPEALVWRRAEDGAWGTPWLGTHPTLRVEDARLAPSPATGVAGARLAVAPDGALIVIALALPGGSLMLHLFEASEETWGVPGATAGVRHASSLVRFGGSVDARVVAPSAHALLVGGADGLDELRRGPDGWPLDPSAHARWEPGLVGELVVGAGGDVIWGRSAAGELLGLWRSR